jgi:hypothetical protein
MIQVEGRRVQRKAGEEKEGEGDGMENNAGSGISS